MPSSQPPSSLIVLFHCAGGSPSAGAHTSGSYVASSWRGPLEISSGKVRVHVFCKTISWSAVLPRHEKRSPLCSRTPATSISLADVDCSTWRVLRGDVLSPARNLCSVLNGEPLPWLGRWRFQAKPHCCGCHDPAAHHLGWHVSVHPTRLPASCAIGARGTHNLALPLRTAHQLRATAIANARSAVYSASPEEG